MPTGWSTNSRFASADARERTDEMHVWQRGKRAARERLEHGTRWVALCSDRVPVSAFSLEFQLKAFVLMSSMLCGFGFTLYGPFCRRKRHDMSTTRVTGPNLWKDGSFSGFLKSASTGSAHQTRNHGPLTSTKSASSLEQPGPPVSHSTIGSVEGASRD